MEKIFLSLLILVIILGGGFLILKKRRVPMPNSKKQASPSAIFLPTPKLKGEMSLEEAILGRRSRRDFKDKPLTLEQLSQILWAAQGITNKERGFRAAPSAGALYPLEIYVVVGEEGVTALDSGVYHFLPETHSLEKLLRSDLRNALMEACLSQSFIADAPVNLIITAEYERTTVKYGQRGIKYVHMEAGHAAQNIYLQVESLGLGTVVIGAFGDEAVSEVLNLPPEHKPLYVMPVGHIK